VQPIILLEDESMFYMKTKTPDGKTVKTEITDENVFTHCSKCGGEVSVDLAELFSDGEGDLFSTGVICADCTQKRMKKHGGFRNINITSDGIALLVEVMTRAGLGEAIRHLLPLYGVDDYHNLSPEMYEPFIEALSDLAEFSL